MSNIITAINQVTHGTVHERATVLATLSMWAIMGAVAASAIAHYIPGDLGSLTLVIGGLGGLAAAAAIKSL